MMTPEEITEIAAALVAGMQKRGHAPCEALSILVVAMQITFRCVAFDENDTAQAIAMFEQICDQAKADIHATFEQHSKDAENGALN
jgi:hypothetical protein